MSTRRKIIILLTLPAVFLAAVLLVILWPSGEPSYNGKTLSEWLDIRGLEPIAASQRKEAIRHIGTNAIPYLLDCIQYKPPQWQRKLGDFLYARVGYRLPYKKVRDLETRADSAAQAFQFLGNDATNAIPALRHQIFDRKPGYVHAMYALAYLGKPGLPTLMEAITNQESSISMNAMFALHFMGTGARPAIPLIITHLKGTNSQMAQFSALALGLLGIAPDLAVPALTDALQTSNDRGVRAFAVRALETFGPEAHPAVPSLLMLLDDPDPGLQSSASSALLKIDPEALKRATRADPP